jgi:hypothetical protein
MNRAKAAIGTFRYIKTTTGCNNKSGTILGRLNFYTNVFFLKVGHISDILYQGIIRFEILSWKGW